MIDIDEHEMMKLPERGLHVEFMIKADVGAFLEMCVVTQLDTTEWMKKINEWRHLFGVEKRPSFDGFASPYLVLDKLDALLPYDAIVSIDTGATLVWSYQSFKPAHQQRFFSNLGNSSMGFALPAAIGAAIGAPGRPVYCIIGDGGMMQNIQELKTALHYNLNIKIFVFNNCGYGIIKQFQNTYLNSRHIATNRCDIYGTGGVDFVAISKAFGVPGTRITTDTQILSSLKSEYSTKIELFDVIIHEEHAIQPKTDFGNSLDNMSPFIDSGSAMIVAPAQRVIAGGWVKF